MDAILRFVTSSGSKKGTQIYLSKNPLKVPGKVAPSMFPNRVLMERDVPSPEPVVY